MLTQKVIGFFRLRLSHPVCGFLKTLKILNLQKLFIFIYVAITTK